MLESLSEIPGSKAPNRAKKSLYKAELSMELPRRRIDARPSTDRHESLSSQIFANKDVLKRHDDVLEKLLRGHAAKRLPL